MLQCDTLQERMNTFLTAPPMALLDLIKMASSHLPTWQFCTNTLCTMLPVCEPIVMPPHSVLTAWQFWMTMFSHGGRPIASSPAPALIEMLSSFVVKVQPSASTFAHESGSNPSSFDCPGSTVTFWMVTLVQKVGWSVQKGLPRK